MNEQEELQLANIIRAARGIQNFLWGKLNEGFGLEEWRRMFRKRVAKIDAIDLSNPYAIIELKKRLLQIAALSVGLLAILDKEGMLPDHKRGEPVSNLPQYKDKEMSDIDSLLKEGEQQWDEVRRILTKASVAPSEPVPLLTGAEMETLFRFYRTYHRIMEETGLAPKAATVRL